MAIQQQGGVMPRKPVLNGQEDDQEIQGPKIQGAPTGAMPGPAPGGMDMPTMAPAPPPLQSPAAPVKGYPGAPGRGVGVDPFGATHAGGNVGMPVPDQHGTGGDRGAPGGIMPNGGAMGGGLPDWWTQQQGAQPNQPQGGAMPNPNQIPGQRFDRGGMDPSLLGPTHAGGNPDVQLPGRQFDGPGMAAPDQPRMTYPDMAGPVGGYGPSHGGAMPNPNKMPGTQFDGPGMAGGGGKLPGPQFDNPQAPGIPQAGGPTPTGATPLGANQPTISGAWDKLGNWNDYTSGVQGGLPPAWWQPPTPEGGAQTDLPGGGLPSPGAGASPPIGPGGGGAAPPAPGTPGAPPTGGPAAPGQPGTPTPQNQMAEMVRKSIMDQLGSEPYDPSADPLFQSQAGAYRTAQQRAQERDRSALAERNAAEGGNVTDGSFQTDITGLNQIRGENEAGFEAGLAGQLNQQREAKIQNALQLGAGFLSQEEQGALQKELAQIQASTAKDLQQSQFGFQSGQSALDRAQQSALQQAGFGFAGGQSALDRAQQTALQGNQFAFQGGQSAQDRALQQLLQGNQFAFQGGQSAQDRALQQLLQGNQFAFQGGQASQDRALQELLQGKNLDFQRYAADLGAGTTTRGQDIQQQLGQGDIDLRRMLGQGQLSLGFLNSLLGRTNFLDQLGFDYSGMQNNANRDAILHLLGG